ncbi:hypothetical protein NSTC731_01152 [Nostoc sp. DSM 114167]|jgi:ATP-dependent Clp protease ATP-binding subunit ClpB
MQPTNPNQFTEKAWEAIAHTPDIVKQYQQQQIESEHLMKALLEQDGLATGILTKAGVDLQKLRDIALNNFSNVSQKYPVAAVLFTWDAAWIHF